MKQKILVLFIRPYSFFDERDKVIEGITVYYVNVSPSNGVQGYGYLPMKANLDISKSSSFKDISGLYDGIFEFVPTSKNLMKVKLVDVEFLSKYELKLG
ncbi:hypothetical protein [Candidatus Pelagibacter communis]|uniref:Uncharacterized protein n=1 Tax=Candidatus Epulonipiscium fishelsonii TaxID=77094 RepID=A0ACC8XFL8_9FIRM|nr:hypothetical protein [Candidatus Pelagibacter ubique]ONI42170.1 hypothetical protein AN396_02280 [Epulopiscium sp. SCG-B11WGA-EpuloA1]ONI43418.1 hypothetical protein AN639_02125 [Epulopiscium sp. SCG-B05WGA-EpuloA1]ONI45899.1 hypothetical protein AN642_01095 [Epulopiscium sp. SCG-B10WGA-EpuloA2]ONI48379.1 hypothetical protein AN643_01695 [Epulopiscium sp. SCG-B10WGA-EpuloB]